VLPMRLLLVGLGEIHSVRCWSPPRLPGSLFSAIQHPDSEEETHNKEGRHKKRNASNLH